VKTIALVFAPLLLAGCVAVSHEQVVAQPNTNEAKIAFDFTEGNPRAMMAKLESVDITRKQYLERGVTPKFVMTFRGEASYFTQNDLTQVKEADREGAAKVQAKLKELRASNGVESMEQCNIPLASRKLNPSNLISEVKLVPNGWIALVGYQQKGYAYIAP
jgi:uncharacterized protein